MLIVREASYRTVPWKNGGGFTREIFREPEEPAPFEWRLSLANIDAPGPFSAFDGYHRTLVLVRGAGVELDFGQHGRSRLTSIGQSVAFDGAWQTSCTLLAGSSSDLNLIVSREHMFSATDSLELQQTQRIQTAQWLQTLVCCISGSIRITNTPGDSADLGSVDVARCSPQDGTITCTPLGSAPARVFIAGLGHR
jgi:environmental stress-induced protein Ves